MRLQIGTMFHRSDYISPFREIRIPEGTKEIRLAVFTEYEADGPQVVVHFLDKEGSRIAPR